MAFKDWQIFKPDKKAAKELASDTGIPELLCLLLQSCGVKTSDSAELFIHPGDMQLSDPFSLKDMQKAVDRISQALDNNEKIAVYGDYDADGITACAIVYSHLEVLGGNVIHYIPTREGDGYGLKMHTIDKLAQDGVNLIITVDNGISAIAETEYAKSLGIDIVITDHHKPGGEIPKACAVVDPHRIDDTSGLEELCGAGVAFKLICAMEPENASFLFGMYSDLLAIGTVADIVPIKGENRAFVTQGIKSIQCEDRIGIKYLFKESGIEPVSVNSSKIAFSFAPRINACGRIHSSEAAFRLLICEDESEAIALAGELNRDNTIRQEKEKEILESIDKFIEANPEIIYDHVIVIDGKNWHCGILGIVASKITEQYGKPSIIISSDGEISKGSGRSVKGFSLYDAFSACSDKLMFFGGHDLATGMNIKTDDIPAFREAINAYAADLEGGMPAPAVQIACILKPELLNIDIVRLIEKLEPFGAGNPKPLFVLRALTLEKIIPIGNSKHLKLIFRCSNNKSISAVKFYTKSEEIGFKCGDILDLAVSLDLNEYNGMQSISIIIKDMKISGSDIRHIIESNRISECLYRNETEFEINIDDITPNRNDLAIVYKFIFATGTFSGRLDFFALRLKNLGITYGKVLISLMCLHELNLIEWEKYPDYSILTLCKDAKKTDMNQSKILQTIRRVSGVN